MKKCTGAQIVINCLIEQGVDTVFGYPGGTILPVYDELYKSADKINHILVAHEQGAAHGADGYARSTGRVGVCMATSGPGSTNLVTGIATAYMDSVPMVCITVNVPSGLIGTDAFQEVDITGVTLPITKNSVIVRDINNLAKEIRKAFTLAKKGRPGPVLIDITKDVLTSTCEYETKTPVNESVITNLANDKLEDVAAIINNAKKPFIIVGGGAGMSGASDEVLELANAINAPVGCTLMGLGVLPSGDEKFMGMLGMHGQKPCNISAVRSDLVIAIGTRLNDRVLANKNGFGKGKKIIQIDIDRAEIDKNIVSFMNLQGDVKTVLGMLLPKIKKQADRSFLDEILDYKSKNIKNDDGFLPKQIMQTIKTNAKDGLVVSDVGQHQMWTAQYYGFDDYGKFLTSGGLGTMGYSLGASIGAKIGNPKTTVTTIIGDGCFGMNCNELATIARYNVPIIIVLMNNGVLGMVRQWQNLFYDKRFSNTTLNGMPDYEYLAKAYDLGYAKITNQGEFEKAYTDAQKRMGATIINCIINEDLFVRPMVAAGKPADDFVL